MARKAANSNVANESHGGDDFERLKQQVVAATECLSDEQVLALADEIHDTLRARRNRRLQERQALLAQQPGA